MYIWFVRLLEINRIFFYIKIGDHPLLVAVYSHETNREEGRNAEDDYLVWGADGKFYEKPCNSMGIFDPNEFQVTPRLSSPQKQQ